MRFYNELMSLICIKLRTETTTILGDGGDKVDNRGGQVKVQTVEDRQC